MRNNASSTTPLPFGSQARQKLRFARHYIDSYYHGRRQRSLFQGVQTCCLFIGHARSGHSIVGALLDAHPNIILPDEVDTLQYLADGFSRDQIYHLLLARSAKQAGKGRKKMGRDGKTLSYFVSGQWQGRFARLDVIGDSKAGKSTQYLAENPALIQALQTTLKPARLKWLHVIRNPYDNISTLILRGGRTFDNAIERYFENCKALVDLRPHIRDEDVFALRQEDFLEQPKRYLQRICDFLGVGATEEYLDACAGILYTSPARSRYRVDWSKDHIDRVKQQIAAFDFLRGYSYDS